MRSPSFGNVCSRVAAESVRGGGVEHADAGTDPSSSSLPELNNESDPLPRFGGREVLELEEISAPTPAAGELLIEVERAGVNFVDIRERQGTYNHPETHGQGIGLPHTPGLQAAGTVLAAGSDSDRVSGFSRFDRTRGASLIACGVRCESQRAERCRENRVVEWRFRVA